MKYYPVFLDIKGKKCLVVGSGPVGMRKAMGLEKSGAKVTMISSNFAPDFDQLKSCFTCREKEYESCDIQDMSLVFAATDSAKLNQQIKKDALDQNILCNVADAPEQSDFLLPSTVERGDLVLAISTSGTSPAMAKTIKQDLLETFGTEYEVFLCLMGQIRKKLLATGHNPDEHKKIFYTLIEKGILELIKAEDEIQINLILSDILGKKTNFKDLVCIEE